MRLYTAGVLLFALTSAASAAKDKPSDTAARNAFEKVTAAAGQPSGDDVQACVSAQKEADKSGNRSDRPLLQARRSYCEFLQALLGRDAAGLQQAAVSLNAARTAGKNDSGPLLRLAADIALLKGTPQTAPDQDALRDLGPALRGVNCMSTGFADTRTCNALSNAASLWLGWMALRTGQLHAAEEGFQRVEGTPWRVWLAGIFLLETRRWKEASYSLAEASNTWAARERARLVPFAEWMGPQPDRAEVYSRLAYTQYMAGDLEAAIPNLDAAIAAQPGDAFSLLLRARVRESLGLAKPAMLDLEAAAKAAPAETAPFYRAVLLERQGDYTGASRGFGAVLSSTSDLTVRPDLTRADVAAWKALADTNTGTCPNEQGQLEKLSAEASPIFPRGELELQALECRLRTAMSLDQLSALDPVLKTKYAGPGAAEGPKERIAAAYIRLGVVAEDKKDAYGAVTAYRRALEWSPRNTKARFNLGALYLGDSKFDLAEQEFRSLLAADPVDHEAQYWLAQSILAGLAARPDERRQAEACTMLAEAVQVADQAKREQFSATLASASCAK